MSSENEIVDPSGTNQPEQNTEIDPSEPTIAPETAVTPSLPPEAEIPQSEPEEDDLEEEDMDWDAWLLTNPEVEEIAPVVEPDQAQDSYFLDEEVVSDSASLEADDLDADDVEVNLADVIMTEFDETALVEIIEEEEELVELLAEVDEMDTAIEAAAQADALETVAEAITEAETIAEHIPDDTVEASLTQLEDPIVDTPVSPPAKPKKLRKHPQGLTVKDVIQFFAPCGRCGYFLTGYRAMNGEQNFEEAVSLEQDGWLTLSWTSDIRELVLKSYGRVVEANDLLFSNACPECSRVMEYSAPVDDGDQPVTFRIEVKPQSGKR